MKPNVQGFTAHAAQRVPCRQGNVGQLLVDLTVSRAVGSLAQPLRRLVALNLLLGKSAWTVLLEVLAKVLDGLGWLHSAPRSRVLRGLGQGVVTVRRYHLAVGNAAAANRGLASGC